MRTAVMLVALLMAMQDGRAQQAYAVADIPAVLKSRADAVVRQESIVVDMQAPTKVRYLVMQAVTVFNRAGEDRARLVIYYDKNVAIRRVSGRVFSGDGLQEGKFTQRDLKDESAVSSFSLYEDNRVKHFLPAMTSYPYTVEYTYELELKQNLIIPAWRPDVYRDVAVEHSRYTFVCGPSDEVRISAANYRGEPALSSAEGRKAMTWEVADIPAQRYEPYSPVPETYQTVVKIAPVDFSYYKRNGRYTNWHDLGRWVYDALLADGLALPERTVQEVKQLVGGLTSDREKAKVLYDYLQRKTRYVSVQIGIGGFKPMSASEVDRLGYGDCKGLVNYMQALLNVAGIPSYYCVVQAGDAKRDLQADFAGMQGNHVILCLPFEQDTTWLECTSQRAPFGFLGSFTDDRVVWACTPEGGRLLRTPRYGAAMSTQQRQAKLELDAQGNIAGKVETVFAGGQYDNHLELAESTGTEQTKLLKQAYDIDQIRFSQIAYQKGDGETPALVETFRVALDRYAPENGGQVFLITNMFNRGRTIPAVKNRALPVYINRGYTDEDQITFTLPAGYRLAATPLDEEIDSPFGYYHATVRQEGDTIVYYRRFTLNEGTFPPDRYAAFCAFINRVSALDSYKAVLTTR